MIFFVKALKYCKCLINFEIFTVLSHYQLIDNIKQQPRPGA
jgi:hypothetical protein